MQVAGPPHALAVQEPPRPRAAAAGGTPGQDGCGRAHRGAQALVSAARFELSLSSLEVRKQKNKSLARGTLVLGVHDKSFRTDTHHFTIAQELWILLEVCR